MFRFSKKRKNPHLEFHLSAREIWNNTTESGNPEPSTEWHYREDSVIQSETDRKNQPGSHNKCWSQAKL